MNANRAGKLADISRVVAEFEGEMREAIRSDVTFLRQPQPEPAADLNNLAALIRRAAGVSSEEIDHLIVQLQDMRDFLRDEGERVQQEIVGYVQLGQSARTHIEGMAEQIARWKADIETARAAND